MDYSQALAYVHSRLRFGIRPGLERMADLMERLGNPQDHVPAVHIAGTNGKGSTSTMIANILVEAGYRTGLFTSPYVCDFMERIQFGGAPGDHALFAQVMTRLSELAAQMEDPPTEFEMVTAAAFEMYWQLRCDAAVIETGLGGLLDCTNLIRQPCVCVLTSISMDHMDILGDTIEQIAAQKCGIMKPGAPVVVSGGQDPRVMAVIECSAREKGCALLCPAEQPEVLESGLFGSTFRFEGETYRTAMPGRHQVTNAVSAILAARELQSQGFAIGPAHIARGIEKTVLPARIQVLRRDPLLLLDGAHNADGVRRLADTLRETLPGQKLIFVTGMMADKEYEQAMALLSSFAAHLVACTPDNPRALPAEELAACARRHGIEASAVAEPVEACRFGIQLARERGRPLVVNGSLYLAGDVYAFLQSVE